MRISFRTLACGVAAFIVGLIALAGLTSDVISAEIGLKFSENGFDMFGLKSDLFFPEESDIEWVPYIVGAVSVFSCFAGVLTMLFGGLSIIYEKFESSAKKLLIVSLVCMLLYMIAGIMALCVFNSKQGEGTSEYTATSAYVPFIFAAIFAAVYFVCAKLVPDTYIYGMRNRADDAALAQKAAAKRAKEKIAAASAPPYTVPVQAAQPVADASMSDEKREALVARYAQLFKDGMITQEEFDEKKIELLSKY